MTGRHRADSKPQKRSKRDVETSDYVAFVQRALWGYGRRIASDPAALVHLRDLEDAFRDGVNLGIADANHSQDAYSHNHMAAILGISRKGIAKRVGLGEQVRLRLARLNGPVVRLADVRTQRAEGLAAVGVEDVTGSEKERRAG